ncbi:MAG: hypothetical protein ABWY12_11150 [Burkholderiales bacterium]
MNAIYVLIVILIAVVCLGVYGTFWAHRQGVAQGRRSVMSAIADPEGVRVADLIEASLAESTVMEVSRRRHAEHAAVRVTKHLNEVRMAAWHDGYWARGQDEEYDTDTPCPYGAFDSTKYQRATAHEMESR